MYRTVTGIGVAVIITGFALGYGSKYCFKHCPLRYITWLDQSNEKRKMV
jgi:hypothetical protein